MPREPAKLISLCQQPDYRRQQQIAAISGSKRLSLAVEINNWWASGIGIRQFSNINYQFSHGYQNRRRFRHRLYAAVLPGRQGLNEYY